jgi:hypothetical protein
MDLLLLKTETFLDLFQSGRNKDWETEILPVIEATINKNNFVFVTGNGELQYDDYLEQLKELYQKGMRLECQNVHQVLFGGSSFRAMIQYHCRVFWTTAGRILADDHTCCIIFDDHGMAIRIQSSHPELYDGIFRVEEKKEERR